MSTVSQLLQAIAILTKTALTLAVRRAISAVAPSGEPAVNPVLHRHLSPRLYAAPIVIDIRVATCEPDDLSGFPVFGDYDMADCDEVSDGLATTSYPNDWPLEQAKVIADQNARIRDLEATCMALADERAEMQTTIAVLEAQLAAKTKPRITKRVRKPKTVQMGVQ